MDITSPGDPDRPAGDHPDVLELVAFARDDLDRAAADRILEHCRSCSDCGDDLAATILLTSLSPRQRPSAWRRYGPVAAAAVLLLAAGLCVASWYGGEDDPVMPARTQLRTLARVPSATPESDAELQRRLDAAAGLAEGRVAELRGMATTEGFSRRHWEIWFDHPRPAAAGGADVGPGARLIVEGRHGEAVALLERSRRLEPDSPEVAGMLGVARYLDGDRSDATRELLRAGVEARSYGSWVQWYLANLHLARGEIGLAADTLARLARRHDDAARRAQALLSGFPDQLR